MLCIDAQSIKGIKSWNLQKTSWQIGQKVELANKELLSTGESKWHVSYITWLFQSLFFLKPEGLLCILQSSGQRLQPDVGNRALTLLSFRCIESHIHLHVQGESVITCSGRYGSEYSLGKHLISKAFSIAVLSLSTYAALKFPFGSQTRVPWVQRWQCC